MRLGVASDGTKHLLQLLAADRSMCGRADGLTVRPITDLDPALRDLCADCRGDVDLVEFGDEEVWLHLTAS